MMIAKGEHEEQADGPPAAYFASLEVKNVRCFGAEAQVLNLSRPDGRPARWTVILGNNGTGKTTLLQALAQVRRWLLLFSTSRQRSDGSWEMSLPFPRPWVPAETVRDNESEPACVSAQIACGSGLTSTDERRIVTFELLASGEARGDAPSSCLPLCYGYGAARRSSRSSLAPLADEEDEETTSGLFDPDVPLCNAEEWLLRLDYSASKPSEIQDQQRKRLVQTSELLANMLPDVDDIRFTRPSERRPTPSVEFHTPYGWVPLGGLGFGYQTMIAWMVDLASRMFERHPNSANPLAEPAVVLVDEIDLHLHPKWQREIIGHLTRLFPNAQFIVTAHSPLIVQAAGDANIVVLRREGDHVVIDNEVESVRGWRIDQIYTSDLFELPTARPPEYDRLLARRKELLGQPQLTEEDERELAELEKQIGLLPGGESGEEARRMLKLAEETQELLKRYGGTGT